MLNKYNVELETYSAEGDEQQVELHQQIQIYHKKMSDLSLLFCVDLGKLSQKVAVIV